MPFSVYRRIAINEMIWWLDDFGLICPLLSFFFLLEYCSVIWQLICSILLPIGPFFLSNILFGMCVIVYVLLIFQFHFDLFWFYDSILLCYSHSHSHSWLIDSQVYRWWKCDLILSHISFGYRKLVYLAIKIINFFSLSSLYSFCLFFLSNNCDYCHSYIEYWLVGG